MAFYKVILTIEKIVESDSWQRAEELARSDISESDLYDPSHWHQYELSQSELDLDHNKAFDVIR